MNNKVLLVCGLALVCFGLLKPNFNNIVPNNNTDTVSVVVDKPSNKEILDECIKVTKALQSGNSSSRKQDSLRLASLYVDIANLISLNSEDEVIKTTDEIRQANNLAGTMLKLGIRDKYPDLQKAAEELIVASIGDDNVTLDNKLRENAVDAFKALAWACSEGAK